MGRRMDYYAAEAARLGSSPRTIRRRQAGVGWRVDFYPVFRRYAENNRNSSRSAWEQMMRDWRGGMAFDGVGTVFEVFEREMGRAALAGELDRWVPAGATYGQLMRRLRGDVTGAVRLAMNRQGVRAAQRYLPPVLHTRGVYTDPESGESRRVQVLEVVGYDDVWHDTDVWYMGKMCRPLEFAGYDYASGFKCSSIIKPRISEAGGDGRAVNRNLTEQEFRFLFAYDHIYRGFWRGGVTNVLEHGTTAIREGVRRQIASIERFGGLIRFADSGILDRTARAGLFSGCGGGNFKMKAWVEAAHNGDHNVTAFLPGNRGRDAAHLAESHNRLVRFSERAYSLMERLDPGLLEKVELGLALTWEQYLGVYRTLSEVRMESRTHTLEGWDGHWKMIYRIKGSPLEIESNGDLTEETIRTLALAGAVDSVQVRMSRAEVYREGLASGRIIRVPERHMVDFLDWEKDGVEARVCADGMFRIRNRHYFGEREMVYRADGKLPFGSRWRVFFNPMQEGKLWVCDRETRRLKLIAPLYEKAPISCLEVCQKNMGLKHSFEQRAIRESVADHLEEDLTRLGKARRALELAGGSDPCSAPKSLGEPSLGALPEPEREPEAESDLSRLYGDFLGD